jgi:uncharacterized membrane protein
MVPRSGSYDPRMDSRVVAGAFVVSGIGHLVRPRFFRPLVPRMLPGRDAIIYGTGVAELVCAAGLVRNQRWAGPVSATMLTGFLAGHLQMALDTTAAARRAPAPKRLAWAAGSWARIPAQLPLIRAALTPPGGARTGGTPGAPDPGRSLVAPHG